MLQVDGPLKGVSLGTDVFGGEKQLWSVDENDMMKAVAGTSICASNFSNRNGIVVKGFENNQDKNDK